MLNYIDVHSDDCWYMCIMNYIFFPTVVLNQEPRSDTVCRGTEVVFTCTTTTTAGYIRWKKSNGSVFFDSVTSSVGTTGQLGNITLNLTNIEMVSGVRVYTSTATLNNIQQNTSIQCSDGTNYVPRTVGIISKWHSNKTFTNKSILWIPFRAVAPTPAGPALADRFFSVSLGFAHAQ